jgi:hypothetical protein
MGLGMSVATSLALWVFLQAAGGGSGFTMLPILLIIPVLYLVMIRPQQKRQKQWQQMLASIKAGDRGRHSRHHPLHQGRRNSDSRGAGRHQAGSGQECDCLSDHPGLRFGVLILPFGLSDALAGF